MSPDRAAAPGALVLVVGPSGAGKDTLIAHAARSLDAPDIVVARRAVTRPPSGAEDHDALDPADFAAAVARGRFAVRWRAHGLDYAIPVSVDDDLGQGKLVLCNVSRGVVGLLRSRYAQAFVVYVDAPLAVRQARIADRGRAGETTDRARRSGDLTPVQADAVVDNGGALAEGCARFEAVVSAVLDRLRSRRALPAGT